MRIVQFWTALSTRQVIQHSIPAYL
jgi:hypothetical protein